MKYDDVFKLYNAKVHLIIIIIGIILGVFISIALNTPLQINIEEQYSLYDEESLELIRDYYTDFYNESKIISTVVFPILFSSIINSIYFLVLLKKQNKATIMFAILFILFTLLSCFMIIPLFIYDIYQIIKEQRKTAILVTHDLSEAISVADRVIVLTKRPATVSNIVSIAFSEETSPLKRRNEKEFPIYFNDIWKELRKNG